MRDKRAIAQSSAMEQGAMPDACKKCGASAVCACAVVAGLNVLLYILRTVASAGVQPHSVLLGEFESQWLANTGRKE